MEDDGKPYEVLSPTSIKLSPLAREMAKMHGMTERDMARHLLNQHKLRESGLVQKDGEN
jgi:hypothetical protein